MAINIKLDSPGIAVMQSRKKIWFFYPSGPKLTGQELASIMILELLASDEHLIFKPVTLPTFDRERMSSVFNWVSFSARILLIWSKLLSLLVARRPIVYLNLGQSFKSLFCDGIPFCILALLNRRLLSVVSLHGHFFMMWPPNSYKSHLIVCILRKSQIITVLGPFQKNRLMALGIENHKIRIVNNTCQHEMALCAPITASGKKINILYLSNLVESKGYRQYLDTLDILGQLISLPRLIQATLCGSLMQTAQNRINISEEEARIRQAINKINESVSVRLEWIKAAYGLEKAKLFADADIFVYPSKLDAQPIVLVEAMAAGCAVISSSVGEIPDMLAEGSGVCLDNCSPENIAKVIKNWVAHPQELISQKQAARKRFESQFSNKIYASTWLSIIYNLEQGSGNRA